MIVYNNLKIKHKYKNSAIAIGNFDGLHLGHKKVLNQCRIIAKKNKIKFGLLTFEPVPVLFFNPKIKNHKINSIEHLVNFVKNYKVPVFPISGDDLKLIGYKTGNELGAKLKLLETKWIEDNFYINKKEVIKSLSKTK